MVIRLLSRDCWKKTTRLGGGDGITKGRSREGDAFKRVGIKAFLECTHRAREAGAKDLIICL